VRQTGRRDGRGRARSRRRGHRAARFFELRRQKGDLLLQIGLVALQLRHLLLQGLQGGQSGVARGSQAVDLRDHRRDLLLQAHGLAIGVASRRRGGRLRCTGLGLVLPVDRLLARTLQLLLQRPPGLPLLREQRLQPWHIIRHLRVRHCAARRLL
jgi:hypothetical protein